MLAYTYYYAYTKHVIQYTCESTLSYRTALGGG